MPVKAGNRSCFFVRQPRKKRGQALAICPVLLYNRTEIKLWKSKKEEKGMEMIPLLEKLTQACGVAGDEGPIADLL